MQPVQSTRIRCGAPRRRAPFRSGRPRRAMRRARASTGEGGPEPLLRALLARLVARPGRERPAGHGSYVRAVGGQGIARGSGGVAKRVTSPLSTGKQFVSASSRKDCRSRADTQLSLFREARNLLSLSNKTFRWKRESARVSTSITRYRATQVCRDSHRPHGGGRRRVVTTLHGTDSRWSKRTSYSRDCRVEIDHPIWSPRAESLRTSTLRELGVRRDIVFHSEFLDAGFTGGQKVGDASPVNSRRSRREARDSRLNSSGKRIDAGMGISNRILKGESRSPRRGRAELTPREHRGARDLSSRVPAGAQEGCPLCPIGICSDPRHARVGLAAPEAMECEVAWAPHGSVASGEWSIRVKGLLPNRGLDEMRTRIEMISESVKQRKCQAAARESRGLLRGKRLFDVEAYFSQ